ncbi:MAG TPA: glutamate synthase, partial [Bacillota bacterium]|nr:glutamate synthase [Bacillota bacterium]
IPEDGVEIPPAIPGDLSPQGRVNLRERAASERIHDWQQIELSMDFKEALHEARRCLRCDHYGSGAMEGGRVARWSSSR